MKMVNSDRVVAQLMIRKDKQVHSLHILWTWVHISTRGWVDRGAGLHLLIGSNTKIGCSTWFDLRNPLVREQLNCILRLHAEVRIGSLKGEMSVYNGQDLANGPLLNILDDILKLISRELSGERISSMQCSHLKHLRDVRKRRCRTCR